MTITVTSITNDFFFALLEQTISRDLKWEVKKRASITDYFKGRIYEMAYTMDSTLYTVHVWKSIFRRVKICVTNDDQHYSQKYSYLKKPNAEALYEAIVDNVQPLTNFYKSVIGD